MLAKHGVSLSLVANVDVQSVELDQRFTEEVRYLGYGMLDGMPHSFAFTMRGSIMRVFSFRRAHLKEYLRHVE